VGVTEESDALNLKEYVFESKDPREIAKSLKTSAEKSQRKNHRHTGQPCLCLLSISTGPGKIWNIHGKKCLKKRRMNCAWPLGANLKIISEIPAWLFGLPVHDTGCLFMQ
jgi:hypothetical protein